MASETPTIEAANLIAAALGRAERTKSWLSERTGIPRTTLTRKLTGKTDITIADIYAIAMALDVEPAALAPASLRAAVAA